MKSKKNARTLSGVLVVSLVCAMLVACYKQYQERWEDSADYERYASEFKQIAVFLLEQYSNAREKWFGASIQDADGRGIYDSDINDLIECPAEVKVALNTICDFGFPSYTSVLEAIRIYNGNVYFCITSGKYALVYSPSDAPEWYNENVEDKEIHRRKIEDHWYHICVEEQ